MRIGFLNNHIDERGSTWQAYLYAKYAQSMFGHSCVMLYPSSRYMFDHSKWTRVTRSWMTHFSAKRKAEAETPYNQKMADRIMRDGIEIIETRLDADFSHLDAIYHLKFGKNDGFRPQVTRYWVHAVFDASQPHGDRYAAVSQWLGREHGAPFVPHIIEVADDFQDMRRELNIPPHAVVFGRFGARGSFDIPWVREAIADSLKRWENVYFLFANTDVKMHHERIIDLPTLYDPVQKRRFINTCDAMLHASEQGETFGIAVGEFAVCGKPVLAYAQPRARSHLEMLRHPMLYNDLAELKHCLEMVMSKEFSPEDGGAYRDCTPEKVMQKFEQVFIQ
jgi:glycosyltransferase involved in cell wall biosynthesis